VRSIGWTRVSRFDGPRACVRAVRWLYVLGVAGFALVLVPGASAAGAATSRGGTSAASRRDAARRALPHPQILRSRSRARAAIAGGSQISIGQAPWQVVVESFAHTGEKVQDIFCGGTILDATHILTAAHCVFNPNDDTVVPANNIYVVAGTSNADATNKEEPTQEVSGVEDVRPHPYYVYAPDSGTASADDVAVLTLDVPFKLGPVITPISLVPPGSMQPEGTAVNLTGFGQEDPNEELNGKLYSLGMTLDSSHECGGEADALFVCAGSPAGSPCRGDSGSALILPGSSATLVGVTDTVQVIEGEPCRNGAGGGFANVAAPEIRDFIKGDEIPPRAPRGGGSVIRGETNVGGSLTCEPGSWSNGPAFTYTFIDSASRQVLQQSSSSAYALTTADVGRTILCEVQAVNAGGVGVGRTPALAAIQAAASSSTPTGEGTGTLPGAIEPLPVNAQIEKEFEEHPPWDRAPAAAPKAAVVTGEVALASPDIAVQSGGLALAGLDCAGSAGCYGKLTLTAKRTTKAKGRKKTSTVTIATASVSIAGDETQGVKFKLNSAGRALLGSEHGHLTATLEILELEPGPVKTQTESVELVLQKAHVEKTHA
jgi:hypothetical protein